MLSAPVGTAAVVGATPDISSETLLIVDHSMADLTGMRVLPVGELPLVFLLVTTMTKWRGAMWADATVALLTLGHVLVLLDGCRCGAVGR